MHFFITWNTVDALNSMVIGRSPLDPKACFERASKSLRSRYKVGDFKQQRHTVTENVLP